MAMTALNRTFVNMLHKNRQRAERADSMSILAALHEYDYSNNHERLLDWGNYALDKIELSELGWGHGAVFITELYLDHNALREFPQSIIELRNLRTLVLGSNELASVSPGI